jgi:hypothetical protein
MDQVHVVLKKIDGAVDTIEGFAIDLDKIRPAPTSNDVTKRTPATRLSCAQQMACMHAQRHTRS